MCNLYSMMKNVNAIRRLFAALNSHVGNLPSMPGIFPDYPTPIVRNAAEGRDGEMGYAVVAARALKDAYEHPQRQQHTLEALAWPGASLPGAVHVF
jgi:hypothetical protein